LPEQIVNQKVYLSGGQIQLPADRYNFTKRKGTVNAIISNMESTTFPQPQKLISCFGENPVLASFLEGSLVPSGHSFAYQSLSKNLIFSLNMNISVFAEPGAKFAKTTRASETSHMFSVEAFSLQFILCVCHCFVQQFSVKFSFWSRLILKLFPLHFRLG
jgi:hypothetical protein